jgi:allophanate hydrolase subunit 2
VIPGPQAEHFDKAALDRLLSEEWKVGDASDRAGLRLEGPPLSHRGPAEIVSDGMLPGCIQVPPDGRPIVMLADAPTTGGYPKIATVVSADLPALGQLLPGEGRLRFEVAALREDWRRGKI